MAVLSGSTEDEGMKLAAGKECGAYRRHHLVHTRHVCCLCCDAHQKPVRLIMCLLLLFAVL